jgi:hypothetical protein
MDAAALTASESSQTSSRPCPTGSMCSPRRACCRGAESVMVNRPFRGDLLSCARARSSPAAAPDGRRPFVAVDQVVGHTRMVGLRGEDRLENHRGLELAGVGLVFQVRGDIERERIEDRGFLVLRIALRELLHRLFVPQHALAPGRLVVRVQGGDRLDIVALALPYSPEQPELCPPPPGLPDRLLSAGAPGLHFYTMNQAGLTSTIWQRLGI